MVVQSALSFVSLIPLSQWLLASQLQDPNNDIVPDQATFSVRVEPHILNHYLLTIIQRAIHYLRDRNDDIGRAPLRYEKSGNIKPIQSSYF